MSDHGGWAGLKKTTCLAAPQRKVHLEKTRNDELKQESINQEKMGTGVSKKH